MLGVLKQSRRCDFDRLHELARKDLDVGQMLGLSEEASGQAFSARTLVPNVSLLTEDLLWEVNQLVVELGQAFAGLRRSLPCTRQKS